MSYSDFRVDLTDELVEDFFCIGSRSSPAGLVGLGILGEHAYARIARDDAPEAIRCTREFADIYPAGSAFMRKILA